MNNSHIHIILRELDEFIHKYYLNEFIKGLILFVLIAIFYVASLSFVEYFAFFPPQIRTVLFYFLLCAAIVGDTFQSGMQQLAPPVTQRVLPQPSSCRISDTLLLQRPVAGTRGFQSRMQHADPPSIVRELPQPSD